MIAVLDTNVIMDALQARQPFDAEAKEILLRAQSREFTCYITANALADIFYLYSKAYNLKEARKVLDFLLVTYSIASVSHKDCIRAMQVPMDDFEDALVVVCAMKIGA